jgi:hypothetical protein
MVANVYQMELVVLHVNVGRVLMVNDVKIKMVAQVNHVKIVVFVLIQVVVHIYVNVVQVFKDQIVNKVSLMRFLEYQSTFDNCSRYLWSEKSMYMWYMSK